MSFSEWKSYKLGDIVDVKHGYAFKGDFFSKEPTAHILLTPGNFKIGGGFKEDKFKYYAGDYPKDYILKEGDIIVTMTDLSKEADTLGYSAKIPPHSGIKYLHNQRLGLLQFKNSELDKDFIYWLLRTKPYQLFIANSATGTTVRHTAPSRIKEYEFFAPGKEEQQKIASILSSLDDKIELNRQTAQTLEAMAQALFKEMCLPKEDELPDGWEIKPLDEVAEFLNGLALQKFPAVEGESSLPVIKIRELKAGITNSTDRASRNVPAKYVIKNGDLLFSWSATLEVMFWSYGEGALNQHLFKVSSDKYPLWFCYVLICHHLPEFRKIASDKTTTMGHIQRKHLTQALCYIPTELEAIDKIILPIFERMQECNFETQTLISLRDGLLPKLMKGK